VKVESGFLEVALDSEAPTLAKIPSLLMRLIGLRQRFPEEWNAGDSTQGHPCPSAFKASPLAHACAPARSALRRRPMLVV
jgi:hypothetical protein